MNATRVFRRRCEPPSRSRVQAGGRSRRHRRRQVHRTPAVTTRGHGNFALGNLDREFPGRNVMIRRLGLGIEFYIRRLRPGGFRRHRSFRYRSGLERSGPRSPLHQGNDLGLHRHGRHVPAEVPQFGGEAGSSSSPLKQYLVKGCPWRCPKPICQSPARRKRGWDHTVLISLRCPASDEGPGDAHIAELWPGWSCPRSEQRRRWLDRSGPDSRLCSRVGETCENSIRRISSPWPTRFPLDDSFASDPIKSALETLDLGTGRFECPGAFERAAAFVVPKVIDDEEEA